MNERLAAAARSRGRLSGSILGLSRRRALAACGELSRAGDAVHLDIIDAAYPMRAGVPDEVWSGFGPEQWSRAEAHLMVGTVPEALPALARAERMTVHLAGSRDDVVADAVLALRDRIWISMEPQLWSPEDVAAVLERYPVDGVLLMLTPPATGGATADPRRLDAPSVAVARRHGPIGVDGGVTDEIISVAADRGVTHFVVGRALLGPPDGTAAPVAPAASIARS